MEIKMQYPGNSRYAVKHTFHSSNVVVSDEQRKKNKEFINRQRTMSGEFIIPALLQMGISHVVVMTLLKDNTRMAVIIDAYDNGLITLENHLDWI